MIKRAKKMVATGYWTSNNFNRETQKKYAKENLFLFGHIVTSKRRARLN